MRHNKLSLECEENSKKLNEKASKISRNYLLAIAASIMLGLLLLPDFFDSKILNYLIGVIPIIITFGLIFFRDKIEKIEGYRELASEFKNLSRELKLNKENKEYLDKLNILTNKMSKYPVKEKKK